MTEILLSVALLAAIAGIVMVARYLDSAHRGRTNEMQARVAEQVTHLNTIRERDAFKIERDTLRIELEEKQHAIDIYREASLNKSLTVIRDERKIDVTDQDAVLDAARRRRMRTEADSSLSSTTGSTTSDDHSSTEAGSVSSHSASSSR